MLAAQRIVEWYERGDITHSEMFLQLPCGVNEDNGGVFLAWAPSDLLRELKAYIDDCPDTDSGWARLRLLRMGSWLGPAGSYEAEREKEKRLLRRGVEVLRDCLGPNALRSTPVGQARPAWGGEVRALARAIHDTRRWGDMPVLADALEEAGESDPDLLLHLRGPGPHFSSCWALRSVLSRL